MNLLCDRLAGHTWRFLNSAFLILPLNRSSSVTVRMRGTPPQCCARWSWSNPWRGRARWSRPLTSAATWRQKSTKSSASRSAPLFSQGLRMKTFGVDSHRFGPPQIGFWLHSICGILNLRDNSEPPCLQRHFMRKPWRIKGVSNHG